jgi:hypothetical protein
MNGINKNGTIYLHYPCFDGIVSCVLAWEFLENKQGWHLREVRPVDYGLRADWLSTELQAPCAVVDFLYHPQAQFWADHHSTTFLTEDAKADFERRQDGWLFYDDTFGSCASLLWARLGEFLESADRYAEMVRWAEKIDSARYSSVEEAILGDSPALKIRLSLMRRNGGDYSEQLVRALRHGTLEEVAQLPEVADRYQEARSLVMAGLDRFGKGVRLEQDGIAIFDVSTTDTAIMSRYAPYYFFPQARYSVGVLRAADSAKITAMRNPWLEFPSIHLGRLFERYGGGGHQRVGSVVFAGERTKEVATILERLVSEIRSEDRLTQGAREGATA